MIDSYITRQSQWRSMPVIVEDQLQNISPTYAEPHGGLRSFEDRRLIQYKNQLELTIKLEDRAQGTNVPQNT